MDRGSHRIADRRRPGRRAHQGDPVTIAGPAAHELRHALADQLAAGHHLPDARWDAAFRAVPREAFLTTFQVPHRDGGLDQYDLTGPERAAALAAVYTDNTLITQVDASGT